jgi:glycosyltransferase involved in cell wall biosynthesis
MALVSIVTPSYNQSAFLEETILSVLEQEDVDIEYIIIDGCSTDGSLDIIEKYARRLAWWVSESDSGQADAINKGLRRATGEYIAWLNSDDLYLPGAVAQAAAALGANPEVGFVFGDAITIDTQGGKLNELTFGDWGLEELMAFRIICQPAVFMRRSVLEKASYLDTTYHYMLDHQLWLRLARIAPIQHIPSTWAAARHHPEAKNVAQPAGFSDETMRLLEWMREQPDLASLIASNRRRVEAGAYRLNGRYLLDGGSPGPALGAYGNALVRSPGFALQHWHRMLYAMLSLVGGKNLDRVYYRVRQQGK